jgi:uncharacterized protein (TIGR03086 family)
MSNEVVERATRLVRAFDDRVRAVPPDCWSNPAPCEGWTARDVVTHVGNNLFGITAGLTGGEPRQISADEDVLSGWDAAREQFLGALPSADLSTDLPGPFGPMPAEQLIGQLIATDVLVHTWDLARAVGGDEQLDPAAVSGAYSGLKPMDELIRRPGVFGPKIDAPADADEQTTFLCFLGRRD